MRRGAAVLGAVVGLVGYAVLLALLRPSAAQLPAGDWWGWLQADPERALLVGLSSAAWLVAAWLFVVTGLSLIAATSGAGAQLASRLVRLVTPLALRRALEAAVAAALAVGPAGMAAAGPASPVPRPGQVAVSLAPVPTVPDPIVAPPRDDMPDLDRPPAAAELPKTLSPNNTASPRTLPPPPPTVPLPPPAVRPPHEVVAGDTLWALAAAALPATASPADITRAWQQWYALNRSTIGADPGLIRPGELLAVPQVSP